MRPRGPRRHRRRRRAYCRRRRAARATTPPEEDVDAGELLVATDARRKEVYWSRYAVRPGAVERLTFPAVERPAELPDELRALPTAGRGPLLWPELFPDPVPVLDVDAAQRWCRDRRSDPDPVLLLDVWNLCTDAANSTGRRFDHDTDDLDQVYDVLFFANNLPAMTPEGEHFVPDWTAPDLERLERVVSTGIALLRAALDEGDGPGR